MSRSIAIFLVGAFLAIGTAGAQEPTPAIPKPECKWQIGLGLQGFGSIFTYGSTWHSGGIRASDEWAPGGGGEIFIQRGLASFRSYGRLSTQIGIGVYSSRGFAILGDPIAGPPPVTYKIIGRYKNQSAYVPGRLAYSFNMQNLSWLSYIQIEWVTMPQWLNPSVPYDQIALFGPKHRNYNWNFVIGLGLSLPSVAWVSSICVQYRSSKWEILGNDRRTIGFQMNFNLWRSKQ